MKNLIFTLISIFTISFAFGQTKPEIKNNGKASINENPKQLPITVKQDPLALPITVKQDPKALPITVKQDPKGLPITVKQDPKGLPITVKNDPLALPITVKPGDKIFIANFANDRLGEMPATWKTNGMGELKDVDGKKWLRIEERTNYETGFNNTLPDNYKVEFDILAEFNDGQAVPYITLTLYQKGEKFREPGIWFTLSPNGGNSQMRDKVQLSTKKNNGVNQLQAPAKLLTKFSDNNKKNIPVHVTLEVNNQNVKAWIDGEKMYDAQDAIPENLKLNKLGFETSSYGGLRTNYDYYISNIQITVL